MDGEQGRAVIDQQARERAEGWVSDLAQKLGEAEQLLATLGGFFEPDELGQSVVGAIGIGVTEGKQQIGPLRQAVRDIPCMEASRAA